MARGPCGGITVTDPLAVKFLRRAQNLSPEVLAELLLLMDAMLADEPRPIIREAALRFALASGIDETEATEIADRFMQGPRPLA